LALEGRGWFTPRLGRFTPGNETLYPFYERLDGPRGRTTTIIIIIIIIIIHH
jgi:hypothetical protein